MDNPKPLNKKPEYYDASSRTMFIEAVEYAGERMAVELREYVRVHGRSPEDIVVKVRRKSLYSPCLPVSRLQRELNESGLTSRLDFSFNGASGELNFNLDKMADEYFGKISLKERVYRFFKNLVKL